MPVRLMRTPQLVKTSKVIVLTLLVSFALSSCASRETRLQTVEQVQARQAKAAQKEALKQAKVAERQATKEQRKMAKAEREAQRNAERAGQAQTQTQPQSEQTAARASQSEQGKLAKASSRLRSMVGKVWPFGKKKQRATMSRKNKPAEPPQQSVSAQPAPQTMRHPSSSASSSASSSTSSAALAAQQGASGLAGQTVELVGVLSVVKPEDCVLASGCGPEYSLLAPDMRTRVYALIGNISDDLKGHLIAVKGQVSDLPVELASSAGYQGIAEVLDVSQYVTVSDYGYSPFISQAASQYAQTEYGCNLLWDKSFGWYLEGKQARFTVRMTNSRALAEPKPYLELAYDGKTRQLVSIALVPNEVNPCDQ